MLIYVYIVNVKLFLCRIHIGASDYISGLEKMCTRSNTKNSQFQFLVAANLEFWPNFAPPREEGSVILGPIVGSVLTGIQNKPWILFAEMSVHPFKWFLSNFEQKRGPIRVHPTNYCI